LQITLLDSFDNSYLRGVEDDDMTTETNGKVIYAEKAEIGKYYTTTKSKIVLQFLGMKEVWKRMRPVFLSTETEVEVDLKSQTLIKEIDEKEAKEMTKKKAAQNTNPKKERKSKLTPFAKIRPYLQSGKPVKSNDVAKKMGFKSANIPDSHIYASFRSFTKKGLVKNLGKGTFQLVK